MRKTRTKLKPNLGEEKGGGVILPPPRPVAVSLNNSGTVKAVTLAFCSI